MKAKIILLALVGSLLLHTNTYASSYYVSYHTGVGGIIGTCAAAIVGSYIGTKMAQKKEEDRIREAVAFDTANRLYIYELKRDYHPNYHQQFVDCVTASCLSESDKIALIGYFNEQRLIWLGMTLPVYPQAVNIYHHHHLMK